MNVYAVPAASRGCYLLDLPGYGWARASQSERAAFGRLIAQTLDRPRLVGVLLLLDGRPAPSPEDRAIQDPLAPHGTRGLSPVPKRHKLPPGPRDSSATTSWCGSRPISSKSRSCRSPSR